MELIRKLATDLGVKPEQARCGARLLFQVALKEMEEPAVLNVFDLVPELADLLTAPHKKQVAAGDWSASVCRASRTDRQSHFDLAGEFLRLGMGRDMISRFVPLMLAYIQHRGGEGINKLRVSDLKED
jgi:hypothetical protein